MLELCDDLGLFAVERNVKAELFEAEEIWLSSTGKELCPVYSIDGVKVGGGFSKRNLCGKTLLRLQIKANRLRAKLAKTNLVPTVPDRNYDTD